MTNKELLNRLRKDGLLANETLWRLVWDNGLPWQEAKPLVDEAYARWRNAQIRKKRKEKANEGRPR